MAACSLANVLAHAVESVDLCAKPVTNSLVSRLKKLSRDTASGDDDRAKSSRSDMGSRKRVDACSLRIADSYAKLVADSSSGEIQGADGDTECWC